MWGQHEKATNLYLTFACPQPIRALCKYKRTDVGRFNTHIYTLLDVERHQPTMPYKTMIQKANCAECDTEMWPIYDTTSKRLTPECVACGSTDMDFLED